jgi:hypothetical protein
MSDYSKASFNQKPSLGFVRKVPEGDSADKTGIR